MKVKKCCCWIPIDQAITCLGFWMCLTLVAEVKLFNPFRLVATITGLAAFFNMQKNDSAKNREYFLYGFMIYLITSLLVASW